MRDRGIEGEREEEKRGGEGRRDEGKRRREEDRLMIMMQSVQRLLDYT